MFPEFAVQFFDSACSGGVDSVREVVADFERGELKPIYARPRCRPLPMQSTTAYLTGAESAPASISRNRLGDAAFRCSFCVIPSEVGGHSKYSLATLSAAIDNALATSPFFSFRRWYPTIIFFDNNFSDDREYMIRVC